MPTWHGDVRRRYDYELFGASIPFAGIARNLRYSARSFARTPVITVALVLTIAVGVGSNAAVHGFIRGLIGRDTPATAVDRVVSLFERAADGNVGPLSYDDFRRLKSHADVFEWLGAARELQSSVELAEREDVLSVAAVTPDLGRLLGLSLAGGVAISQQLRETAFQGRPDSRGERLRVDGSATRVGSVAPDWLDGLYLGRAVDIWIPLDEATLQGVDRASKTFWVIGRLRSGVSVDQALAALAVGGSGRDNVALVRYTGMMPEVADGLTRVHGVLAFAAGAVFLIVCANVASFLLARASARSRETSVRVALGASRTQLLAQLLSDSVIIALAGGAFGVLLAVWTSDIVPALLFEADAGQLAFVPDVLGVAVAASACAGLAIGCGLTPLLEVRFDRPATVLRREGMGPSTAMARLRAGLVVAEMAACCVLVISTGLVLQTFRGAVETSAGRKVNRAILATVQSNVDDPEYFKDVEKAVRTVVPRSTRAWVARPPGSRATWRSFRIEPPRAVVRDVTIDVAAFTPDTLEHIMLPPVAGRLFGASDGPGSCRVAVVNDVAADQLFGGNAVGTSIQDPTGKRVEIIGVVRSRERSRVVRPTIYYFPEQTRTPLGRTGPASFRVRGPGTLAMAILNSNVVSRSYFDGTGSTRIAGQLFPGGSISPGCRVGVIDQETADRYFGGTAVGGAVIDPSGHRTEIIGVVSSQALGRLERRADPSIYFPMQQDGVRRMTLIIDTGAAAASDSLVAVLREQVESVPGRANVPAVVEPLEQHLARTALAPLRIALLLVRASAAMALVLAVAGVYGALTEATRRRRREIGVRIALGAQAWRVIGLVVSEGGRLAALGAAAGMLAAIAVRQMLVRFAPAAPFTIQTWLAGPLLLFAVVVLASVVPALRAVMVDPVTVLKDDG